MSATIPRISDSARRDLAFAALTLALFLAVTFAFPGFAAPRNLAGLLDDTAILIMLALGQMLVILVRGIDLSIAANLALCGMVAALFNRAWPGMGVAPVLALHADRRRLVRRLQRPAGVEAAAAAHRGDARHHVHLSRRDLPAVQGRLGQRERDVARVPGISARRVPRGLGALVDGARGCGGLRLRAAAAREWRAICTRRAAIPRRQTTPASIRGACSSSRTRFAARSPACAAICGWRVSRWRTPTSRSGFELSVIAACLIGGVAIAGGVGSAAGRRARLPVHRHHPQQSAAGRHLRVLADVHQWRGDPGRGAAERAAAAIQAHHPRGARMKPASLLALGDRCWRRCWCSSSSSFSIAVAVFPECRHALGRDLQLHRARDRRAAAGAADHRRRDRHLGGRHHRAASVAMGLASAQGVGTAGLVAIGLGTGLLAGCINGALVTIGRVPSIVATIGTMTLFRGAAYAVLGDRVLKDYPDSFAIFGQGYLVGPDLHRAGACSRCSQYCSACSCIARAGAGPSSPSAPIRWPAALRALP